MGYGIIYSESIQSRKYIGNNASIYGYVCGGEEPGVYVAKIDVFDATVTSANASHVGNLPAAKPYATGLRGKLWGFICGGNNTSIHYIDTTLGVTNGFAGGTCRARSVYAGQCGVHIDNIYGFIASSTNYETNKIEYVDMTIATVNAIDGGTLSAARQFCTGV